MCLGGGGVSEEIHCSINKKHCPFCCTKLNAKTVTKHCENNHKSMQDKQDFHSFIRQSQKGLDTINFTIKYQYSTIMSIVDYI